MGKVDEEMSFLDKNRLGYKMLKDAIFMMFRCNCKAGLNTEIFPQVGKKYGKSGECVERNIRYVLKKGGCNLSSKKFIKDVVTKMYN